MSRNSPSLPPSETAGSSDELLNRVLAGLRDTEPPAGIERRIVEKMIVQKMEDRVLSTSARYARKPFWLTIATAWSGRLGWAPSWTQLGALALAVLAISLLAIHLHRNPRDITATDQPPLTGVSPLQASPQPTAAAREAAARALPRAAARRPLAPPIPESEPALLHPGGAGRTTTRGRSPAAAAQTDSAGLALSEMRAPSQPAPEMPLTNQERLLRRIAHRGDPVELAELDPAVRDADTTKEKAEFQAFFEPPQSKSNP